MVRAVWAVALALAAAILPATLCAARTAQSVAVTIKPLHSLVASVMQGAGSPDLILKGAGSPHAYSLKPSDAVVLYTADVVFWIGPELETFLIRTIESLPTRTRTVALAAASGITRLEARDGLDWSDPHHPVGHHHTIDPHIWLDPKNAEAMATAIADHLAKADPANAQLYASNRDHLIARIQRLTADLARRLSSLSAKRFIVYHDAYAYFEKRFGLTAAAAMTINEGRAPGARHIARLRRLVKEQSVRCVFVEPQFEPRLARVITEATPARIAELDPLGAAHPAGPDQYFDMMTGMADAMHACLSKP